MGMVLAFVISSLLMTPSYSKYRRLEKGGIVAACGKIGTDLLTQRSATGSSVCHDPRFQHRNPLLFSVAVGHLGVREELAHEHKLQAEVH
jgi:hypothetical protein